MDAMVVASKQTGARVLLSGNEALARGALEAGIGLAASYPGSPTVEILATLARVSDRFDFYAEWSVNEIVALEAAAGASYAGLRAIASMKPDGFNVALDFATSLAYAGIRAGLVIVVGDDPGAHSSLKEEDCRPLCKAAGLPVLEPASVAEAKEMVRAAFELSEKVNLPVVVRATTRICHASGDVVLGETAEGEKRAAVDPADRFFTHAGFHPRLKQWLAKAAAKAEGSPFNDYRGPEGAERLIVASGVSALYAAEALEMLGLADRVGLLKLGTSFPLPRKLVLERLKGAKEVVFCEENDPFIEEAVMVLAAQHGPELGPIDFHGQTSGRVAGNLGPGVGELNADLLAERLGEIFGRPIEKPAFPGREAALAGLGQEMPKRELTFCAGCPHRASFWSLRKAITRAGKGAVVLGDIGCYTLALGRTGYFVLQSTHCMGGGMGLANGLGQLGRFGLAQPVVSVLGDSTFYHGGVPALINARRHSANLLCVILDNRTTAMTGGQPHPGSPVTAGGSKAAVVGLESLIEGIGVPVTVQDPYDVAGTIETIKGLLDQTGPRVLVLRRECALEATRQGRRFRVSIDAELCDGCGLCSKKFSCPANVWDEAAERAVIDQALCVGCGVCAELCPQEAIIVKEA